MVDWETVKLPKQMVEKVSEFVDTEYAQENGYTSKSQVVVSAVREFLKKYAYTKISVTASTSNNVILSDKKSDSPIFVTIKNKKINCSKDGLLKNEKPCIHMALSLYETPFYNTIKKIGILSDFGKDYNEEKIETDKFFLKFFDDGDGDGHVEVELNDLKKLKKVHIK